MPKKVVKNINKVLKNLERFGDKANKMIAEVTEGNASEIMLNARSKAPINKGKLAQSITTEKDNDLNYRVVVGLDYGAYIEFGTGKKVNVPSELKDQASKFKNRKGSFKEGLQSIKDWCRAKGIEESAAYPIFISILNNGIQPQPYLYPAFVKGRKQYLKDLKDNLKALINKYD
jgi:HK97 gp10 family phage protein